MKNIKNRTPGSTLTIPGMKNPLRILDELPRGHYRAGFTAIEDNGKPKGLNDLMVVKIIDAPESCSQFSNLCNILPGYRDELYGLGVPTPRLIITSELIRDDKRIFVEVTPHAGESVHNLLVAASPDKATNLVKEMIRVCIRPLYNSKSGEYLPIGIDPAPRNHGKLSTIYYLDLWSPKVFPILEYPQPIDHVVLELGNWRHYTFYGLVFNFFMHISRVRPDLKGIFRQIILDFLREIGAAEEIDQFENSPDARLERGDNTLEEILDPFEFKDVFSIRIITSELAAQGRITPEDAESVYQDTHFRSEPIVLSVIDNTKEMLLRLAT